VLSNRGQPFFTPHPLPLVRGAAGLKAFVREHGATFCVMRAKEWGEIEKLEAGGVPATSEAVGNKLVLRVPPAGTNGLP